METPRKFRVALVLFWKSPALGLPQISLPFFQQVNHLDLLPVYPLISHFALLLFKCPHLISHHRQWLPGHGAPALGCTFSKNIKPESSVCEYWDAMSSQRPQQKGQPSTPACSGPAFTLLLSFLQTQVEHFLTLLLILLKMSHSSAAA